MRQLGNGPLPHFVLRAVFLAAGRVAGFCHAGTARPSHYDFVDPTTR
jgi:hypothetical protein